MACSTAIDRHTGWKQTIDPFIISWASPRPVLQPPHISVVKSLIPSHNSPRKDSLHMFTPYSSLPLARRGLPLVDIRLPSSASAPEEFAAEELRRMLYEIIGAGSRLRTPAPRRSAGASPAIYVNDAAAARSAGIDIPILGREAFHIETRGGRLYLVGGGPRGVPYALYALL